MAQNKHPYLKIEALERGSGLCWLLFCGCDNDWGNLEKGEKVDLGLEFQRENP